MEEKNFDQSQTYRAGDSLEFIGSVSVDGATLLSPESHGRAELTNLVVELTTLE